MISLSNSTSRAEGRHSLLSVLVADMLADVRAQPAPSDGQRLHPVYVILAGPKDGCTGSRSSPEPNTG